MKFASTLFLKAVLVIIGAVALALVVFVLPGLWVDIERVWPVLRSLLYPGLSAIAATILPFFFALYQAFLLLRYIDANNAFSTASIQALKLIKYSAVCMTVLYFMALPLAYGIAELDDAPGLILFYTAFACAPLIVATFAAVLQKLVQSAFDLKTENDLTV